MKLEEIKDPRTRGRIEQALQAAKALERDLRQDGAKTPSMPTPAVKVPRKRIRQSSRPLLTELEKEYMVRFLDNEPSLCAQQIRFKLANGLWYKPDFFVWPTPVIRSCQPLAIEVKGPHAFRGGFENLKMAAHQYPWIKWILVWKENDEWREQVVLP